MQVLGSSLAAGDEVDAGEALWKEASQVRFGGAHSASEWAPFLM